METRADAGATGRRCAESALRLGARPRVGSQFSATERRDDVLARDTLAGTKLVIGSVESRVQTSTVVVIEVVLDRCKLDLRSLGRVGWLVYDESPVLHACADRQHAFTIASAQPRSAATTSAGRYPRPLPASPRPRRPKLVDVAEKQRGLAAAEVALLSRWGHVFSALFVVSFGEGGHLAQSSTRTQPVGAE
jgi:hypothetical protein